MTRRPREKPPTDEPEWLFPYEFMDVGHSFFIPTLRPAHLVYTIDVTSKKAGVKMLALIRHENGILGVRAWRLED